jgi:hypothetical protein
LVPAAASLEKVRNRWQTVSFFIVNSPMKTSQKPEGNKAFSSLRPG